MLAAGRDPRRRSHLLLPCSLHSGRGSSRRTSGFHTRRTPEAWTSRRRTSEPLALGAADCAEHVPPLFDKQRSNGVRLSRANAAARDGQPQDPRSEVQDRVAGHAAACHVEDVSPRRCPWAGHPAATALSRTRRRMLRPAASLPPRRRSDQATPPPPPPRNVNNSNSDSQSTSGRPLRAEVTRRRESPRFHPASRTARTMCPRGMSLRTPMESRAVTTGHRRMPVEVRVIP